MSRWVTSLQDTEKTQKYRLIYDKMFTRITYLSVNIIKLLLRNCLLNRATERKIEVRIEVTGRTRKQLLNYFEEKEEC